MFSLEKTRGFKNVTLATHQERQIVYFGRSPSDTAAVMNSNKKYQNGNVFLGGGLLFFLGVLENREKKCAECQNYFILFYSLQ